METFGAGGEWFADADALIRRLQSELSAGCHRARQGLARQSLGARGAGAHRRRHGFRPPDASGLNRMLLYLTEYLAKFYSGFHVFQYLTLRGILAAMTTLAMALFIGPRMIATLARYQIGQRVRTDGPQTHLQKSGTPTMGGGLILVAMVIGTLLWADLSSRFVWILLATTLAFGAIGFYDDYLKLVVGNSKGLAARYKYLAQSLVALVAAYIAAQPASDRRRDHPVRALLQDRGGAHDHARLRRVRLFRDRRHQQCGESHRRPRWPRHHAGRDGGRPRSAFSPTPPATSNSPPTCRFPISTAWANC